MRACRIWRSACPRGQVKKEDGGDSTSGGAGAGKLLTDENFRAQSKNQPTLPRSRSSGGGKGGADMTDQIVQQPAFERQKPGMNGHTSVANGHRVGEGAGERPVVSRGVASSRVRTPLPPVDIDASVLVPVLCRRGTHATDGTHCSDSHRRASGEEIRRVAAPRQATRTPDRLVHRA